MSSVFILGIAGGSCSGKTTLTQYVKEAFGEKVINSYIKLRNSEIDNFNSKENFSKDKPITTWEKLNTLDC